MPKDAKSGPEVSRPQADAVFEAKPEPTPASASPPPRCVPAEDSVPLELRTLDQWVAWKYVNRNGKWTKCPVDAKTGRNAKCNDPSTWSDFSTALDRARRDESLAGIGLQFAAGDGLVGVDLDGCIGDDGVLSEEASEIIEPLGSYGEISPSRRGVKVFIRARILDAGKGRRRFKTIDGRPLRGIREIEIYQEGRFFTVTGRALSGSPDRLPDAQHALNALMARLNASSASPTGRWSEQPAAGEQRKASGQWRGSMCSGSSAEAPVDRTSPALLDDDSVREGARRIGADRFERLSLGQLGDYGGDASRADAAFCRYLALAGGSRDQIERIVRSSGLYRGKWDRADYARRTIEFALSNGSMALPDGQPMERHPPGTIDPHTGRLILSRRRTLPTAQAFVRRFHDHPEHPTMACYAGTLWHWSRNRWSPVEDEAVRATLSGWLHESLESCKGHKGVEVLVPFAANPRSVEDGLKAVRAHTHVKTDQCVPSWLNGREHDLPPADLLAFPTGTLHVPSGRILAPTPRLFATNALDFDYTADPEPPERWIAFMEQLFGEDLESMRLLQEFMGYSLVADTSQQKMLMIVGPKRSGKGTIGRVWRRLVGEANVVSPTVSSLAQNFGLAPLIGKSLAIVSDARFKGDGVSVVTERLLCISGEDAITIDRKHKEQVTLRLHTRFVILTNELPTFNDASGALAGRFLILTLRQTFYGREDPNLTDALYLELPGILRWCVEGLKRLRARGRFIQTEAGRQAVQELEELTSPVAAFVREECMLVEGARSTPSELFAAWKAWCDRNGREWTGTLQAFGRDLQAAAPSVTIRRGTHDRFYEGIRLGVITV